MTDKRTELCAVCHHPANEDEGELISVAGTVPNTLTPAPRIQRVHKGCRQYVNEP